MSADAASSPPAVATSESGAGAGPSEPGMPLGFGFSAGGLLFPYLVGAAYGLQETGLLTENSKLAGASAGSLVAGCFHSGVTMDVLMEGCRRVTVDCRENGTGGRLKDVLSKVLHDMLPDDCHLRCSGKAYIAVTKVYPKWKGILIKDFHSRDDMISAMLTSCHIPWWFDTTFVTDFREQVCTDGGASNLIPAPPQSRPVRICCFPVKGWGDGLRVDIAPDIFKPCKYSMGRMIGWAFQPPEEDEIMWELAEMGKQDAKSFAALDPLVVASDSGEEETATMVSRLRTVFGSKGISCFEALGHIPILSGAKGAPILIDFPGAENGCLKYSLYIDVHLQVDHPPERRRYRMPRTLPAADAAGSLRKPDLQNHFFERRRSLLGRGAPPSEGLEGVSRKSRGSAAFGDRYMFHSRDVLGQSGFGGVEGMGGSGEKRHIHEPRSKAHTLGGAGVHIQHVKDMKDSQRRVRGSGKPHEAIRSSTAGRIMCTRYDPSPPPKASGGKRTQFDPLPNNTDVFTYRHSGGICSEEYKLDVDRHGLPQTSASDEHVANELFRDARRQYLWNRARSMGLPLHNGV
eukprot:evm.model.scf_117.10 EVM.evm.TU.scf_117.10   scf_117:67707-77145(+)